MRRYLFISILKYVKMLQIQFDLLGLIYFGVGERKNGSVLLQCKINFKKMSSFFKNLKCTFNHIIQIKYFKMNFLKLIQIYWELYYFFFPYKSQLHISSNHNKYISINTNILASEFRIKL